MGRYALLVPNSEAVDDPHVVGVAALIRGRLGECSPAERRVARTLLAAYPSAGLGTVAALAERAEVSAPTVLRLLSRLGFGGYPEFQRALRDELAERETSPLTAYRAAEHGGAPPEGALPRAATTLPAAVAGTLADLPRGSWTRPCGSSPTSSSGSPRPVAGSPRWWPVTWCCT